MEVPKDLGRRIVEAARLAVALHLQHVFGLEPQVGGADIEASTPMDERAFSACPVDSAASGLAEQEAE
jgi:hypothetical protein